MHIIFIWFFFPGGRRPIAGTDSTIKLTRNIKTPVVETVRGGVCTCTMKTCRCISQTEMSCPMLRRRVARQWTIKTHRCIFSCLICAFALVGTGFQPVPPARDKQERKDASCGDIREQARRGNGGRLLGVGMIPPHSTPDFLPLRENTLTPFRLSSQ